MVWSRCLPCEANAVAAETETLLYSKEIDTDKLDYVERVSGGLRRIDVRNQCQGHDGKE